MKALLHKTAEKYLNRLTATDQDCINNAIDELEKDPPQGNIEPVIGQPGRFRTRVGSYRLLWRIKEDHILVTHIDPRGQVYKKKNKGNKR